MGDFGFENTICAILITIVICALSLSAGITDVISMIGKQGEIFRYIVLIVWAVITVFTALRYKKGLSSFMLYLTCHSVVSLVYGWLGSKMLQGMIYPWGSYNGWFEGLFLKSLYSVIGIFFIILLFALTQGYILVIQIMQEEAFSESREM